MFPCHAFDCRFTIQEKRKFPLSLFRVLEGSEGGKGTVAHRKFASPLLVPSNACRAITAVWVGVICGNGRLIVLTVK